jgi:hypothetical protein
VEQETADIEPALREDDEADGGFVPERTERLVAEGRARRVVSQPYDLSIQTLVEQIDDKGLVLATDFQRNYVWDEAKASRLIESLLLNIPIPVCYFAEDDNGIYEVVDGHQRLHSIWRYLKGDFPLRALTELKQYKSLRFLRLPPSTQRDLQRRTIRCVVFSRESDPDLKFDVFERLNTNAVSLNAQELRNCIYRGQLNVLLKELVLDPEFRRALGRRDPDPRMRDHELVLRFLALNSEVSRYKPPLKKVLNNFMDSNRKMDTRAVEEMRASFVTTIRSITSVFGDAAFRRIGPDGARLEDNVNRALFDVQMLCFCRVDPAAAIARKDEIIRAQAALFGNAEFEDSIGLATADRARMIDRLRLFSEAMSSVGLPIDHLQTFGQRTLA